MNTTLLPRAASILVVAAPIAPLPPETSATPSRPAKSCSIGQSCLSSGLCASQRLLEPVVCVALVVEGVDLLVAGGPVEAIASTRVSLVSSRIAGASAAAAWASSSPEPAADAEPARRVGDPHWLSSAGSEPWNLSAPSRSAPTRAWRRGTGRPEAELVELGGDAQVGVEAALEAPAELGDVLAQARLGLGLSRIDDANLDARQSAREGRIGLPSSDG